MRLLCILTFVLFLSSDALFAQSLPVQFSQTFKQDWKKEWLSSGQKEFYISNDGQRIVFLTDRVFQLRDGMDGSLISSGTLLPKSNKQMNAISFSGGLASDAVNNFDFAEGAGFAVYPAENMMVMLDWNADKNYVKAFDMESGKMIWDTDEYQYAASLEKTIVRALLQTAAQQAISTAYLSSASFAGDILLQSVSQAASLYDYDTRRQSGYTTFSAAAFVTPMEGSGKILLRSGGELVALDLQTGEEQWRFDDFPMVVGFQRMLDEDRILLVNNNSNFLQKEGGSRTSVVLDVNTGEELLRIDPKTSFQYANTYVLGDNLVMASEGLEIYDLNTGERLVYTLQDEEKDAEEASSFGKFLAQDDGASNSQDAPQYVGSQFNGDFVYTTYARDLTGTTILPAQVGLTSKINIAKFDPYTAERIWTHEKISGSIVDVPYANEDDVVMLKDAAFGAPRWLILDAKTGELKKEMKMETGFALRTGPSTIWNEDVAYYSNEDGLFLYNTTAWEEEKFVDVDDMDVGKMQAMVQHKNGLTVICTKGMVFLDDDGNLRAKEEIKKVSGAVWNDSHCLIFTKDGTHAYSMDEAKKVGTLDYTPVDEEHEFYITADNDKVITITEQQEMRAYTLK